MPPAILSQANAERHPNLWARGVLGPGDICEFGAWSGGDVACVLPQRSQALEAMKAGARVVQSAADLPAGSFAQCIVHLQKSRAATLRDVCEALRLLVADGELLVVGYNELGIRSLVANLEKQLGAGATIRSNRRKGRAVGFKRSECESPPRPADSRFEIDATLASAAAIGQEFRAEPGVFSADRLDPGSALLLKHLQQLKDVKSPMGQGPRPAPARVLDLGCGAGPLGLLAAALWPQARVLMLDGDVRAVRSARANATRLALSARVAVQWWDAAEPLPSWTWTGDSNPTTAYDLVLINPPFHTGKGVDMGPAIAMFDHASDVISAVGSALIVANRTLPYEPTLKGLGSFEMLEQARGFKLMCLRPKS